MKLLFLCQEFPFPPTNGIRIKVQNIIKHMALSHECHVLGFGAADTDGNPAGVHVVGIVPLKESPLLLLRQGVRLLTGGELPSALRWKSKLFGQLADKALTANAYDVLHLDMVNMYQYAQAPSAVPTVLSINDSASRFFERSAVLEARSPLERQAAKRLNGIARTVERTQFHKFDAIHVVSDEEKRHLVGTAGLTNVQVVPIGVEDDYLNLALPQQAGAGVTVLVSGNMGVRSIAEPTVRFLTDAWPAVVSRQSNVRMVILGGRNSQRSVTLAASRAQGVELVDWSESYVDMVARADVGLFLDARAGGMKNRVLQALAAGRAVVASTEALEGIQGEDGTHYLVARDTAAAAHRLDALLANPELRLRIGTEARKLIRKRYTLEITGRAWEGLYQDLAARRGHGMKLRKTV